MRPLKRNIAQKTLKLLDLFPVIAILGPRQSGKTTLAKTLMPTWTYFDLEKAEHQEKITYDPGFFFEEYPEHIILDEAQSYPELFDTLRGVIDAKRSQKGRFILTGSSSPLLLKQISESLAGRIAIIELGTLKANEFHETLYSPFYQFFNESKNPLTRETLDQLLQGSTPLSYAQLSESWLRGGFPEPTLNTQEFFQFWMEQYRNTYINRDIAKLFPKINRQAYNRFLEILCQLSGTILNKSEVARAIEVSEGSVREYLQIIEGTFLWRSLPSFEKNVVKSIVKMPKGHITDTGLLHYLLRISNKDVLFMHPARGHSFETFIIEEIIKGLQASFITNWNAYHYRTRDGAEIDLVLEGNFGVVPIEIKHGSKIDFRKLKTLESFVVEHKCPLGILINNATHIEWIRPQIVQIPAGWL